MDTPTGNGSASAHAAISPRPIAAATRTRAIAVPSHSRDPPSRHLTGMAPPAEDVTRPPPEGTRRGASYGGGHRRQSGGHEGGRPRGVEDTSAVARACATEGPHFGPRLASRQDREAPPRRSARAPCRAPDTRVLRPRSRRGDRPRSTGPAHLLQGTWTTSPRRTITARMDVGHIQVNHPGEHGSRVPRMWRRLAHDSPPGLQA